MFRFHKKCIFAVIMNLQELNHKNHIRTVSLFSGAGGLDIGAIRAGAHILWANDFMKEAFETYSANIGDHILRGDINDLFDDIKQLNNIDLIIGGPPCQGFSVAGKMDLDDKRSKLIWSYLHAISIIRPKAFVMENVKAFGKLKKWEPIREKLLAELRRLGYSVNYVILNACDFDVPQSRERIFVIGFKGNSGIFPDLKKMLIPYMKKSKTVKEALSALDKAGTGNNQGICKAKITLAAKPILRKSPYAGMLFNGLGRPVRINGYCATLPASMGGNKTPIIDEKELYENELSWVEDYHKQLVKDISIAKFKSAPSYLRRLTVQEATILQTFPIDYDFKGSQSSKYTQIGNAVPCHLSQAVVSMVIDVLDNRCKIK